MSPRELVVLGTASQAPTRQRNHNGYVLRWDDEAVLFDPGEGTQRQMLYAGVSASQLTRICVTHFHGDHCLGLPGVLQRLSLDRVPHPVEVYFPASGVGYWQRLRGAAIFDEVADVRPKPVTADGVVATGARFSVTARRLDHRADAFGWRIAEPDGRRIVPEQLEAFGLEGPAVGRLQRDGVLEVNGHRVTLEEVSEPRPGQRMAFVMDTRWCDGALALAEGVDLLVCEATYLSGEADLADERGHLTAAQAAQLAARAGARRLVLTHFSQRYTDPEAFRREAEEHFPDVVVAGDLDRIAMPARR